jgi:hypothetical protein
VNSLGPRHSGRNATMETARCGPPASGPLTRSRPCMSFTSFHLAPPSCRCAGTGDRWTPAGPASRRARPVAPAGGCSAQPGRLPPRHRFSDRAGRATGGRGSWSCRRRGRLRIRVDLHLLGIGDQGARHGASPPAVPPVRALHQLAGGKPGDARGDARAGVLACGEAGVVIGGHGRPPSRGGAPRGAPPRWRSHSAGEGRPRFAIPGFPSARKASAQMQRLRAVRRACSAIGAGQETRDLETPAAAPGAAIRRRAVPRAPDLPRTCASFSAGGRAAKMRECFREAKER